MAWSNPQIDLDPGKSNVGQVTATWNAGLPDEFTFSDRGIMTAAGKAAFVTAARAAQAADATKSAAETSFEAILLTALNA